MRVTVIAAGFDRDRRGSFSTQNSRSDRPSILDGAPDDGLQSDTSAATDEMDIPGFVQG
jgi:hypothetical protein